MKFTRTLFKAMSWRLIAVLVTGSITFALTGSLVLAGSIAGIDSGFKIVVFMIHEWLWERKRK